MLILICHTYPATKKQNLQWFGVDWQETWLKFRRRISRHSIETRFALRLSVVLTISCGAKAISHANHVYWFPLNAFLLLQPSFEDSEHRLTRPIGTALGCLLAALAEGKNLWEAADFANALAALSVQKIGTTPSMPVREEIDAFMAANRQTADC